MNLNEVDNYLSLKRIVMMTLAITIGYYSLFALSHYFGRPSFADANEQEEFEREKEHVVGANEYVFGTFQRKFPALFQADRFQPGHKFDKPRFSHILLFNVPFTFLMILSVFLYNRKVMSRHYALRRNELMINILGTLLIAGFLSSLCTIIQLYIWPYGPVPRSLIGYISRGMLGDFTLVSIAFVFSYLQRSLYYETLKTQMDPHFLFNSLNTLKALIDVDADKAGDFVHQLSTVMRYTLKNEEVVTLSQELDCVRSYCRMMKMRYGDNLLFEHHIDHDKYDNYYVLPLSIQGLIENAIKHNVISSRQPLTVHIMTDDDNHLIISNKIQLKIGKEEGTGIGLANLVERYRIKWNENVEIFDDGKIFSVTLPLKQND